MTENTDRTPVVRLAALDTCAVSDALERSGLPGAVVGLVPITVDTPFAGRVQTVELVEASDELPARHLCTAAVDASGPGDVIVVANAGRTHCAGWGGLLSRAATSRGIEGIVVDGACRDVPEAVKLGLAVYARAPVAVTARGKVVERSWGEPVVIGSVEVAGGDLVIADASGVAFVPQDRIAEVLDAAEQIAAREARMAEAIEAGARVSDVMDGSYEAALRQDAGGA